MKRSCHCIGLCFFLGIFQANSQVPRSFSNDSVNSFPFICDLRIPIYVSERASLLFLNNFSWLQQKKPLLAATGELGYQHFDRNTASDNLLLINSSSDMVTLRLDLLYKDIYPYSFSARYNKSRPFQLDDQYEINIGFDERQFKERLRDKIAFAAKNEFLQEHARLMNDYKSAFQKFQKSKQYLESPGYAQQLIQQRLKAEKPQAGFPINSLPITGILEEPGNFPNRIKDSVEENLIAVKEEIGLAFEHKRDSLLGIVRRIEDSIFLHKKNFDEKLDTLNRKLSEMSSPEDLNKYGVDKGVTDSPGSNLWSNLLMKSSLRLGKFILNSSELTVNNIYLHGLSLKYGDRKFILVSGGYYDFAFRELFRFRNDTTNRSRTPVFAIKLGKTDGKGLTAANFYIGRKVKQGSLSDELRTVAGVSLEKKLFLNRNISIDLEIAKSTTRNSTLGKDEPLVKDLITKYNMRTIGAYGAVKAYFPRTKTDADISYRYWGQQFESFNASQYFNPQNNFTARISQPLFGRRLYLNGGLKYTDFKSFGIASNLKTRTFFASANGTLRIKKLPILSIGYYPGSQLYYIDQSRLYEYYYYILNGSLSHYFKAGKVPMQAVLTYNKFFNRYTDSLVAGANSYFNLFWTSWLNAFSFQANYSRQESEFTILSTAEAGINYGGRYIRIGGSIKWNYLHGKNRMGYAGNFSLQLKKIGTISLIYDYSYLPDRTGFFIPVKTGHIQITKPLKFTIWQ